ncbi:fumarylacetoacetate hydrolase family protein [Tessaracoccus flavus]|jgi:2-keto-4-pentenoate hydratase/2-oxohepta-3-ene-1,7-dioic acid hydratase in catechol pathway|uniref:2-hydroxyhepta-2,4-diene-1,7-dioate isomerase n=1 Tax=Tessaracoccus flavus TaxID=1610493 RepID=A0A1Q2CF62_9ACTN|nr:fumarylacetoacetate hydrolase family protein [Tessaracoccus flavus]AQP44743.1 2-hydroxyhepta-2,4-diene-1,7-dioate isomerase [Tessaracoccus flavus]SDZ16504.1 2-keto-4-pentenoate hydratase/2-oxohepta-3-ene-1,7-dioic acid hydratase (catechol pathway) [Tessaracoccus flavus]
MRIARFAKAGQDPTYGIIELAVDGGEHPDTIAALTSDPLAGVAVNYTGERHDLDDVRLLAPVIPRSKVVGVGRNYAAHAAELGNEVPAEPLLFFKPNTSVIGPTDTILLPDGADEVHFEGELAIVIGRICKEVPVERAADVIFGYTIANDVTCRNWQQSDGQWARAKGADTFCPIGPWINTHLTPDEAGRLSLQSHVNGELKQDSNTSHMIRGVAELVSYISAFTTLLPGDLILTGTPEGVGLIRPGDEVNIDIDGLGTLSNPVDKA